MTYPGASLHSGIRALVLGSRAMLARQFFCCTCLCRIQCGPTRLPAPREERSFPGEMYLEASSLECCQSQGWGQGKGSISLGFPQHDFGWFMRCSGVTTHMTSLSTSTIPWKSMDWSLLPVVFFAPGSLFKALRLGVRPHCSIRISPMTISLSNSAVNSFVFIWLHLSATFVSDYSILLYFPFLVLP